MKVAAAAAILAAFLLGLSLSGVFAGPPAEPRAQPIELTRDGGTVSSAPSPEGTDGPEWVGMQVQEDELDDHGGRRRDAEREEDNSGRGSDDATPEPDETDDGPDNSGSGSSNSGPGSANSGRDDD